MNINRSKSKIFVSFIIPAFNASGTISDTLTSLINQTYPHWEAIVIDDGSTDNTKDIVKDFINKDNRIHLFSQENQGESGARNSGIKLVNYEWLVFLDSDDWILPRYLERMINKLNSDSRLDGTYCGWTYITPDNKLIFKSVGYDQGDIFAYHAGYCFSIVHTYIIKKALVIEAGGFDQSLITCPDWDLWQRISRTGAKFGSVPDILAIYRIRAGSASRNVSQLFKDGMRVIIQGHSYDQRVLKPHQSHINGQTLENLLKYKYDLACTCAGYLIGQGKDARILLGNFNNEPYNNLTPFSVASAIYKHTMISSSKPFNKWEQVFNNSEQLISDFLNELEKISQTKNIAARSKIIINHYANIFSRKDTIFNALISIYSHLILIMHKKKKYLRIIRLSARHLLFK